MGQEEKIRDYLAKNLSFLASDLLLIRKEFPLNAEIGARGFIDILAKDSMNNFVIIEIKRSESAARQTINEVLKYQGLIKQLFKAQESEIKIIIVSTSWHELIIPFSEIFDRIFITGYEIELNNKSIPIKKKIVKPIELNINVRKLSPTHSADLFYNSGKRDDFLKIISARLLNLGIKDFVIVKLKSSGHNHKIIYPYASYMAFQRQSRSKYFDLIKDIEDEIEGIEFDSDEHEISYIESCLLLKLETHLFNDTAEYANPVKFMSILSGKDWIVENIEKYGAFKNDPRFSNEMIIDEIKGYDGTNRCRYLDFADSTQIKKLEKILINFKNSISENTEWLAFIVQIFEFIKSKSNSFRVVVDIFYPYSIFDSIWRYYESNNNGYLPHYNLFFFINDSNEILQFKGSICWNGKFVNSDNVLKRITRDDAFLTFLWAQNGSDDKILIRLLNLRYVNTKVDFINGVPETVENMKILNKKLIRDNYHYQSIEAFYENNQDVMIGINQMYESFSNGS